MGCCFSVKKTSGQRSDSSSLSRSPPCSRRSKVTAELRQRTSARTQHEETEVFRNPKHGVDPTLESEPRVALPRLIAGGEQNAPDGSKPVRSTLVGPPSVAFVVNEASGDQQRPKVDPEPKRDVKKVEEVRVVKRARYQALQTKTHSCCSMCSFDDLGQGQSQWGATDEPGPSALLQTSVVSTPPPKPDAGLLQCLLVDQMLVFYTSSLTSFWFITIPPPGPDDGLLPTPPGPDYALLPPPSGPDYCFLPTLPGPDYDLLPPPSGPDYCFLPTLPGPDYGLLLPPPGPDADLLQYLLVDQMLVYYNTSSCTSCWFITIPPPGLDDGLLPTPPGPDYSLLPTLPGQDYDLLPPPPGPDYDFLPPPPGPDAGLLQYLLVDQMPVYYNTSLWTSCWFMTIPPPGPDYALLPPHPGPYYDLLPPPPGPDYALLPPFPGPYYALLPPHPGPHYDFQPPPPGPEADFQPPPPGPEADFQPPPPGPEADLLPPPPGPELDVCHNETSDGPTRLTDAPEDLGTLRTGRQDVGTQTLPPGACRDACSPSYLVHSSRLEQPVMAEGGDSGVKMKEVVSELRGDVADLPLPEPRIKLGPRSRRARARARGTLWAGFPQTSCSTLCQRPGASSSPNQKPAVCSNPDVGLNSCHLTNKEPQQLRNRFSGHYLPCCGFVGRLPVSQLENTGVNNSSSLVREEDFWPASDSSSLSRSPPYGRRSKVTAELRQRTSARTQHEETEVFRNPTHGVDPTLESDPRVALPRLIAGGEQNAPDGSKPVRSTLVGPPSVAFVVNEASGDQQRSKVDPEPKRDVKKVEEVRVVKRPRYQALQTKTHSCCSMCSFDDLGQGQSQWGATDEPGPSALLQTSVVSTPPPKPDAGLLQCLLVDQMLVFYTSSLTSCWCITIPPPGPDDGLLPTPPGPDYSLLPPPPGPDYSLLPPPPGPDYALLPTLPGPEYSLLPPPPGPDCDLFTPPPGPGYDLLPPPPGPDYSLLPTLPGPDYGSLPTLPGPDYGLLLPPLGPDYGLLLPPPGPDADLLQYLLVDQMLVYYNTSSCTSCWFITIPPPGLDDGLLPTPPGPDCDLFTPPPGPGYDLLPPPPGPDYDLLPPPPGPDYDFLPPPPGPDAGFLQYLLVDQMPVYYNTSLWTSCWFMTIPPCGPDYALLPPPPGPDYALLPPHPGPYYDLLPPHPGPHYDFQPPPPGPEADFQPPPLGPEADFQPPPPGPELDVCHNEMSDGPTRLTDAPEDLGTLRTGRQDVGTQTLPPGACRDACSPSYLVHSSHLEQPVMAEGGDSRGKMKEVVSELRGDVADLPLPEPRIKLGPRSRRARARARGTLWAAFPQTSCSTLCQRPGASSSPNQKPAVCSNPDVGLNSCHLTNKEPQQLRNRFSGHYLPCCGFVGRLPVSQLENTGVNNSSRVVTMGCCFSVKKTSGQRSDSSSLSRRPAVDGARLIAGGEQNAPDGSKPVRSTLVGPPSVAFVVNEASGDQQRPKVDPEPKRDVKKVEEVRVVKRARYQALQTKTTQLAACVPLMTLAKGRTSGEQQMSLVHPLCCKPVWSQPPPPKPDAGLLQCLLVDQMLFSS
ncbi:hypothetical protein D4764_13G0008840 [Takifugu flavidus]|uniref:Uncharacterized protein n=1 Tax=Takifugu flavidus TaxID=433684 RepID=A0A5C6P920_9TELE|nr:hypothetical protein D4764_13G0008840 [Takifugu flavidus]